MAPQLHIVFFPFMAQGHILPTLDMAKVFSSRGVKATLITTNYHVPTFERAIQRSRELGFDISVRAIKFPSVEAVLPEGTESIDQLKSVNLIPSFLTATSLLQDQLEQLLQETRPHCLVADSFFPWATDAATKFGIPRLVFHGMGCFAVSAFEIIRRDKPYDNVSSDSEPFVLPHLPHGIMLTRAQIPIIEMLKDDTPITRLIQQIRDSELKSYGVIVNSFHELEPDYFNYYTEKLGRRAWSVGPLLLCNKEVEDKAQRGHNSAIDAHECLKWLDSKNPNSVIYLCFGSILNIPVSQLHEIAKGLEIAGQDFIWVVRSCADEEDTAKWFPQGFAERTKEKGLIIKGWAPQLLILEHEAIAAFVTHCGWNSTLEGVCSGVPLITWPSFGDQFLNEKLLTEVLEIGVGVGAQELNRVTKNDVKGEALAMAVERVTMGEEGIKLRGRSKALKEMARKTIEEGGSSYSDFNALIAELKAFHSAREHSHVL